MNELNPNDIRYKHLNRYWKSLLSFKIEPSLTYYSLLLFDRKTNIGNVVDPIINYNQELKTLITVIKYYLII